MGREIKRVPFDFTWELNQRWWGFLMPDTLSEKQCEACDGSGTSPFARQIHDQLYGNRPFSPEETGSTPLTRDTPAVRAFAERNVRECSWMDVDREADRLAGLWNGRLLHHLDQDDVDALVAEGRLMDFTHTWSKETGWVERDPKPTVLAADVNTWSLSGFGHDSINAWVVLRRRCEAAGEKLECDACAGHGSIEVHAGQRAAAEAWKPTPPPTGDGWQLWETVSEGSPISPVFATADELSLWLQSDAYHHGASTPMSTEQADRFVASGWAPTLIFTPETGVVPGEQL